MDGAWREGYDPMPLKVQGPGSDVSRQEHRRSPRPPTASTQHGHVKSLILKEHICRGTPGTQTMGWIGGQTGGSPLCSGQGDQGRLPGGGEVELGTE